MSEVERIKDQLQRSVEGDAWHGPALRELLADVSAEEAAAHPIQGVHSIRETTLHVTYWLDGVRRRMGGELVMPDEAEQWPSTADAWEKVRSNVETRFHDLAAAVGQLDDERLTGPVPGKKYDVYFLLHGLIQHNLYHAGQIAILKKALRGS